MVNSRHSVNVVPCRKGLDGGIHHQGETLGGQLGQEVEETPMGQVDVDPDREERVNDNHPSVRVESDHRHPFQAGDQVHI